MNVLRQTLKKRKSDEESFFYGKYKKNEYAKTLNNHTLINKKPNNHTYIEVVIIYLFNSVKYKFYRLVHKIPIYMFLRE